MSYDLTFFKVPTGTAAKTAFQELMQEEESKAANLDDWLKQPLAEATRTHMQKLADSMRLRWPAFVQFQPAKPLPWIELNDEDLPIQVTVGEKSVSVNIPYFRQDHTKMTNCLGCCLEVIQSGAGYAAYDPQLGRIVGANDLDEIAKTYSDIDAVLPTMSGEKNKVATGKKPWWKIW